MKKFTPSPPGAGSLPKSDIQPILNQGGRKEDVAASIFQAVVDQTVAGLTQGRELKGTIVFLGGPLHFLAGLRQRFVETLHLDQDHAIFPEDGDCFAAIGAAPVHRGQPAPALRGTPGPAGARGHGLYPGGHHGPAVYLPGRLRGVFRPAPGHGVPTVDLATYTGPAYLGIDAGSTTTKMVLIDPDCNLLYSFYHSNQNPVSIVLPQLRKFMPSAATG